jgi:hypothetical protein
MKIKTKINEEEYSALDETFQKLYEKTDDGYRVEVEGAVDSKKYEIEREHRNNLQKELKDLQQRIKTTEEEGMRKRGDVDAIEKSYQQKLADIEKQSKIQVESLQSLIIKNTVDAQAARLASELAGEHSELLLPHIRSRMSVELSDSDVKVRVIGLDGKPTADSIDDLKNAFLNDAKFAPVVIGSRASGAGGGNNKPGNGGRKKLSDMTATEEAIFARQNPQEYEKMLELEG